MPCASEAQNHFKIKSWPPEELGTLPVKPLKAGGRPRGPVRVGLGLKWIQLGPL